MHRASAPRSKRVVALVPFWYMFGLGALGGAKRHHLQVPASGSWPGLLCSLVSFSRCRGGSVGPGGVIGWPSVSPGAATFSSSRACVPHRAIACSGGDQGHSAVIADVCVTGVCSAPAGVVCSLVFGGVGLPFARATCAPPFLRPCKSPCLAIVLVDGRAGLPWS